VGQPPVILMLALFGAYYALTHRPKRKGKIVFIQDAHNNGWSKQNETEMNLRLGGSFAYTGAGNVHILKLFLKGTRPLNDLLLKLDVDGGGHMIQVKDIHLSDTSYRMSAGCPRSRRFCETWEPPQPRFPCEPTQACMPVPRSTKSCSPSVMNRE
jgi:hypothetical protein